MSESKKSIWESISSKKEDVLKALNLLLALEFTSGVIVSLRHVNFFKICEDLGIKVDKSSRNQDTALNACADTLSKAGVAFTPAITETFSNFKVKIFDNGGISITGSHPSYSGGFFEWSKFHTYVEVGDGFAKVGHMDFAQASEGKLSWKDFALNSERTAPNRKAKPKKGLPGAEKDPNRYVEIQSGKFKFFIDTSWSVGKVFLDKKAYLSLIDKSSASTSLDTSLELKAHEANDED